MNSNKQRRKQIMDRRRVRAANEKTRQFEVRSLNLLPVPLGAVAADTTQLFHNHTRDPLPTYYIDRPFTCRECGAQEVWTATQQKWWYEVIKGHINSSAVHCLACRRIRRSGVAAVASLTPPCRELAND